MSTVSMSRRQALSLALGAAVVVPFAFLTRAADAAQNAALRAALKYQDAPMKGQQCSTCTHFITGKNAERSRRL